MSVSLALLTPPLPEEEADAEVDWVSFSLEVFWLAVGVTLEGSQGGLSPMVTALGAIVAGMRGGRVRGEWSRLAAAVDEEELGSGFAVRGNRIVLGFIESIFSTETMQALTGGSSFSSSATSRPSNFILFFI